MVLEVRELVAGYYGSADILHGINLKTLDGGITVVIGPNGAGKSTLLKTIYGMIKPRSGKVYFNGHDITGEEPHKLLMRGITYIPQHRTIFPALTVYDNLRVNTWLFRKDKERIRESLEKVYSMFPVLKEKKDMKAGALSGGEQKMLEVAKALIHEPKLILVDEPTAGLAPSIAIKIYSYLEKLRESNITVLLVDQNVRQAVRLADYVYEIDLGRVKSEGSKEDFEKRMEQLVSTWI